MNKFSKAITLIEMVVVIAILGTVSGIVYEIFTHAQKTYSIEQAQTALQSDNRASVDQIARQTKKASTCLSTYSDESHNFTAVSGTNSDVLILKIIAQDASGNLLINTFDYLIYKRADADPSILREISIANTLSARQSFTKTLMQNVSALSFTYLDSQGNPITSSYENATMVKVQVNGQDINHGKTITSSFASESRLRNK